MKTHEWTYEQATSASVPSVSKKFVIEPALLELIGEVEDKQILELGSGSGYWLNLLSAQGANCTGVEMSKSQLELARKSNPGAIQYFEGNITEPLALPKNNYDVIFLEHVLLEIPEKAKLYFTMENAYALVKKGGVLVVSDLHPFAPSSKPTSLKVPDDYHYFRSGEIFEAVSTTLDGQEVYYKDFHWTLEDLMGVISGAGFHVVKIVEPRPSEELVVKHPELVKRLTNPVSIMVKAVKC